MKVTGQQLLESVLKNNIKQIDHHRCSFCDQMTRYYVINGQLYFDSSCFCTTYSSPPELESWDEAANWINNQSNSEIAKQIALRFGIDLSGEQNA